MEGEQLSLFSTESNSSDSYFTRKRSWSASKHRILLRYIQSYCYNLGGNKAYQSDQINYVDCFAGSGKYEEGIGIEDFVNNSKFWASKYQHEFKNTDGSPLIALKCAKLFNQERRVNLRCFFIESNLSLNQQLQDNCKLTGENLFYKIYEPQKFEEALPKIFQDLHNYPTFFFLDTFGVKGVTFEQICSIGNYLSQHKGELFLLFHNRQVARHAGHHKISYDDPKQQKTSKTYTRNLTKLLGSNSDKDWKPNWLKLKTQSQEFEKWALEYFKDRIRNETNFKGVTSFEVKETYNDNRPQYSIVVGSNHPEKAFGEFINEFVWEEEKLLFFQDSHQGSHKFLEKEWNSENDRRIAIIKPLSVDILKKIRPEWISFKDVITQIILGSKNIGLLKRTQYYNDILGSLYKEGILEIKNPGSKKDYTLKSLLRIIIQG